MLDPLVLVVVVVLVVHTITLCNKFRRTINQLDRLDATMLLSLVLSKSSACTGLLHIVCHHISCIMSNNVQCDEADIQLWKTVLSVT
jgi:hypothetical protein